MNRRTLAALIAGVLFGFGLVLSRMIDPRRVQGFLDVGDWDPTLLLVIIAAISTAGIGYRLTLRRRRPLLDEKFHLPQTTGIDARLVIGAILFGIGWGLAGYCPGPALTGAALGFTEPLIVFGAMVAGSVLFDVLRKRRE